MIADIENKYLSEGTRLSDFSNTCISTVYLHIGIHKTATSSIQAALYGNKDRLYKKGIYYSENRKAANAFTLFGLFNDVNNFYDYHGERNSSPQEIAEFNKDNLAQLLEEIKNTRASVFVFSEEHLFGIKSIRNLNSLKTFLNLLMPKAKIMVVCCLRNPVSFATSSIQQQIGGNLIQLPKDDGSFTYKVYIKNAINCYLEVFGKENLILYKYEDALKHKFGPAGYFANKILKLPKNFIPSDVARKKVNESRSYKALEIISYINQKSPYYINKIKSDKRSLHDCFPIIKALKGEKFKLTEEQQRIIYDSTIEEMLWLKEVFGIDYTEFKIQDAQNDKTYDAEYAKQIVSLIPKVTPLIRMLILEFVKEKAEQIEDAASKERLKKLVVKLNSIATVEHALLVNCTEEAKWYNEIANSEEKVGIPQIYRNIALFCERHGQINAAYQFMKIAKDHAGANAPIIDKKCAEYSKLIKTEKDKNIISIE